MQNKCQMEHFRYIIECVWKIIPKVIENRCFDTTISSILEDL